ncbi:MAG TPA: hypothetical protein DCY94_03465 [Firmicutes bacterium]|nr:hypothetical protein [Bacillota bacterium]
MIDSSVINKKDLLLMQLAHYFITVENYTPIVVKGVKNEIWLENIDAPYKIVRINANYVHNNEQLDFDLFKIRNIVKQVRKKTLSFSINTLNILIDIGSNVEVKEDKKIQSIFIDPNKDLKKNKEINSLYPELKNNLVSDKNGFEFIINVTNDINIKTENDSKEYERVFKKKTNIVTYTLMAINILLFIVAAVGNLTESFDLYTALSLNKGRVLGGEIYRFITSMFMHENLFHLLMNMYALQIIGTQVESYIGKTKFITIYMFSGIIGGLLSCVVNGLNVWSLGASGAIFGLMGALLYFGYHYRLYLDSALKTQIVPLIAMNLMIGFIFPNIDNAAHIGGLVGGLFSSMALGIKNRTTKTDAINGTVCSIILFIFLCYIVFFAH